MLSRVERFEMLESDPEREQLADWLDSQLNGIVSQESLKLSSLKKKFKAYRAWLSKDSTNSFTEYKKFLQSFDFRQNGSLELPEMDEQSAPASIRDSFKRFLIGRIPEENFLRFLKRPDRLMELRKEGKESAVAEIIEAESIEDIPVAEIPLQMIESYINNPFSQKRFVGFHTSNQVIPHDEFIKPGRMPEAVSSKENMPETGWSWYSYGDTIYGSGAAAPSNLYLVEGYSEDFGKKINWDDHGYRFMGVRRPLKTLQRIDIGKDQTILTDLGLTAQMEKTGEVFESDSSKEVAA